MHETDMVSGHNAAAIFIALFAGITSLSFSQTIKLGCQTDSLAWRTPTENIFAGTVGNPWVTLAEDCKGWISDFNDPFDPQFIDECKPYHIFRMMDLNKTNAPYAGVGGDSEFSAPDPSWESRIKPTDGCQWPVCYEFQVDLCNRINADLWLCVPHESDDEYCYNLAQLVKDRLDPHLKIYVEWSNETWNGMFVASRYAEQRGAELGLGSGWEAGAKYHAYAAVRVFEQFERVFGTNSPRLVKVVSGQCANSGVGATIIGALSDPTINPNNIKVDGYAVAPYFSPDNLQQVLGWIRQGKQLADASGMDLLIYEGGLEKDGFDEGDYDLVMAWLEGMEGYVTAGTYYMHAGKDAPWSLLPSSCVGYEAAKTVARYRAVAEYCERIDKPAISISRGTMRVRDHQLQVGSLGLEIIDALGRVVPLSSVMSKNRHSLTGVPSGMYVFPFEKTETAIVAR